jgi:hypothetical protein
MLVGPEFEGVAGVAGGEFDFPEDEADPGLAIGGGQARRVGKGAALEVVAVAAGVALGVPGPVEALESGAEGQGAAGEGFGLGLFPDQEDQVVGAAEAGVVIEVVHLGVAAVVFEAEGDGGLVQGHRHAVGARAAVGGEPGGARLGAWGLGREVDTRARFGGGLAGLGGLEGSGVEAHRVKVEAGRGQGGCPAGQAGKVEKI